MSDDLQEFIPEKLVDANDLGVTLYKLDQHSKRKNLRDTLIDGLGGIINPDNLPHTNNAHDREEFAKTITQRFKAIIPGGLKISEDFSKLTVEEIVERIREFIEQLKSYDKPWEVVEREDD